MEARPSSRHFGGPDYFRVNVLVFAIAALWQSLHSIILPLRVLDFVPEASKNTYLGVMTFTGLLLAMVTQPLAGALSDRSRSPRGRRRPFIAAGILTAVALLLGLAFAPVFAVLFVSYCLMQVASNVAQGPYQAFLPALVPMPKQGRAAGVKNALEITGGVTFIGVSSLLMGKYGGGQPAWRLDASLGMLGLVLLLALGLTLAWVKEPPPSGATPREPLLRTVAKTFRISLRRERPFLWFLVSRMLVFMGLTTIQQFAQYFLRDVLRMANASAATFQFLSVAIAGMLLAAYPAGHWGDRLGKRPIACGSALLGAVAVVLIIVLPKSFAILLVPAFLLGLALGAFSTTNWAMALELVARGEEARYLGLANMATAGGAALARLIGPAIDFFNARGPNLGYTVMLAVCVAYFVAGAFLLLKVRPNPSAQTASANPCR